MTNNDGIREIDVTIYDDYPIYLMENAWDLDNIQSVDDYADFAPSSGRPSNKFDPNNFYTRNDVFVPQES